MKKRYVGNKSHTKIHKETRPKDLNCRKCDGKYMLSYGAYTCYKCGADVYENIIPDKKLARESRRDQKAITKPPKDMSFLDEETIDWILRDE